MPQFMTTTETASEPSSSPVFHVRPAEVDDFSTIRHVHALSIQRVLGASLTPDETTALAAHVRTPEYTSRLMAVEMLVAIVNDRIVGTVAWSPSPDGAPVARISCHFVHPLFVGVGIGRALIEAAIVAAGAAGFSKTMARVPLMSVSLYETAGFSIISHGVAKDMAPSVALQVAFMRHG